MAGQPFYEHEFMTFTVEKIDLVPLCKFEYLVNQKAYSYAVNGAEILIQWSFGYDTVGIESLFPYRNRSTTVVR